MYSLIDLYFFSSCTLVLLRGPMVHDGRWRGVRSSGGRGRRPNPLTSRSPFCFVIWGGGGSWGASTLVLVDMYIVHGSRKGRWQGSLSALSANTHTRRVAVKRVNQILKLPLSPLYKRKGKRRFSPWVTFFRPAFIIQACFSEEMEKCELDFLRNLDLFSVVRNLLVPFTACPANVTDSPALQCQHDYPAYSLFRL